jgi:uncharacterized protein GlcG (DUF336 family)
MKKSQGTAAALSGAIYAICMGAAAFAQNCPVNHDQLQQALKKSVQAGNGGFGNQEWAAVVGRDGAVCAVTFSGTGPEDQWLGSRAIAAEKAYTVNAFSSNNYAVSSANLYAGSQPGGYLYGTAAANPPDPSLLLAGKMQQFGTASDPWLGKPLGGIIVFGGGLPLYQDGHLAGGLGVSGDTSCADHNVAWRVREALKMDKVPDGPSPSHNDQIIYDIGPDGKSASGFGHPKCHMRGAEVAQSIGAGINVASR